MLIAVFFCLLAATVGVGVSIVTMLLTQPHALLAWWVLLGGFCFWRGRSSTVFIRCEGLMDSWGRLTLYFLLLAGGGILIATGAFLLIELFEPTEPLRWWLRVGAFLSPFAWLGFLKEKFGYFD